MGDNNHNEERERTLYVSNLHPRITEDLLKELFIQAGPVEAITIREQKTATPTPNPARFAFVEFGDTESVLFACQLMDAVELYGQKITVKPRDGTKQFGDYLRRGLKRKISELCQSDGGGRQPHQQEQQQRRQSNGVRAMMMMSPPPPPPSLLPAILSAQQLMLSAALQQQQQQLLTYGDRPTPLVDTLTVGGQQQQRRSDNDAWRTPPQNFNKRSAATSADSWGHQRPQSSSHLDYNNRNVNNHFGTPSARSSSSGDDLSIIPPPPAPPNFYQPRVAQVNNMLERHGGKYQNEGKYHASKNRHAHPHPKRERVPYDRK